jgi:hypothetical protein
MALLGEQLPAAPGDALRASTRDDMAALADRGLYPAQMGAFALGNRLHRIRSSCGREHVTLHVYAAVAVAAASDMPHSRQDWAMKQHPGRPRQQGGHVAAKPRCTAKLTLDSLLCWGRIHALNCIAAGLVLTSVLGAGPTDVVRVHSTSCQDTQSLMTFA